MLELRATRQNLRLLFAPPDSIDSICNELTWEHHNQWLQDEDDDDDIEEECQSYAWAIEYNPETMEEN